MQKLCGRLSFASSHLWGRGPRIFMRALFAHCHSNTTLVSNRTRASLVWWSSFLEKPLCRIFKTSSTRIDGIIYSDASLSALGCTVVHRYGTCTSYHSDVPMGFLATLRGENEIYILELLATLFAANILRDTLCVGNYIHFCDNNAALSSLLKGYSPSYKATCIIGKYWERVATSNVSVWIERVRSKWNKADDPSRKVGESLPFPFPSP